MSQVDERTIELAAAARQMYIALRACVSVPQLRRDKMEIFAHELADPAMERFLPLMGWERAEDDSWGKTGEPHPAFVADGVKP